MFFTSSWVFLLPLPNQPWHQSFVFLHHLRLRPTSLCSDCSTLESSCHLSQLFCATFPSAPPFPIVASMSAPPPLSSCLSTTPLSTLSILLRGPVPAFHVCVEAHCHAWEQVRSPGRGVWRDVALADRTGTVEELTQQASPPYLSDCLSIAPSVRTKLQEWHTHTMCKQKIIVVVRNKNINYTFSVLLLSPTFPASHRDMKQNIHGRKSHYQRIKVEFKSNKHNFKSVFWSDYIKKCCLSVS